MKCKGSNLQTSHDATFSSYGTSPKKELKQTNLAEVGALVLPVVPIVPPRTSEVSQLKKSST